VNISSKDHTPVSLDDESITSMKIEYTYSAKWHPTEYKKTFITEVECTVFF